MHRKIRGHRQEPTEAIKRKLCALRRGAFVCTKCSETTDEAHLQGAMVLRIVCARCCGCRKKAA